jgi:hypothetical protein
LKAEVPVTMAEALTQLRDWCDRSRGEKIEIAPGITASFQSRGTFNKAAVREIEEELGFKLPSAYYEFMAVIGESSLFGWSPSGGHWYFYNPRQVIDVSQEWGAAQPEVERFCFVGEHRSMGDMMGFCIDRPSPTNFDIYCHEYPFEEYVAISDEIKSWREFRTYVAGVVSRFGQDSL